MIVYFSSGTTGNPKMAMHAHTYALAHLTTAKYWHDVTADSIHLTIADTGWGKAVWGKLYGEMFMESCVLSMTMTSSTHPRFFRYLKSTNHQPLLPAHDVQIYASGGCIFL